MAKNRFEQVDELQDDAITLCLQKQDEAEAGTVHCPAALTGGRTTSDITSDKLPPVEAFRSAVKLANEIKAPIVVMDPEGLWKPEWGDLYRPV
jgi:hypothetical protein